MSTTDLTSRLAAIIQELAAPFAGYSDKAIRRKMEDGVWREGAVWLRSAGGEILIDMEGYEKWCKGR
jgi:hypothetical protein